MDPLSRRGRSRNKSRSRPRAAASYMQPNPDYVAKQQGTISAGSVRPGSSLAGQAYQSATPLAQLLRESVANGLVTGSVSPLARDPRDNVAFGPATGFLPAPLDPVPDGQRQPDPRGTEYELVWNLRLGGDRLIPWSILRDAADNVDMIRNCIQIRKKHFKTLKWSFTVKAEAIQEAYQADPRRGHDDIAGELREKYGPEIKRLTKFWRNPWRGHLRSLKQWVNMLQEEQIVLDAVAIYPQRDGTGNVHSFRIIDGTTIKPLLNYQGHTPMPPFPAYQQILYGFPRGEWMATPLKDADGNPVMLANGQPAIEGGMPADELFYWRENTRTFSPYGQSDVERALIAARLYLKRQGWMVSEYDDGTAPVTWLVPDGVGASEVDHRQRRIWEDALNDELSGHTRARHRIKVTPPGFKPEMQPNEAERYKPEYDLHLIKVVAAPMGVNIAELGFTEAKGLGSAGYHEGQDDVQDRNGRRPDREFIADLINELSYEFLGMSDELEIQFTGLEADDEAAADGVADTQVRSGRATLNEDRRRRGQPLYNFAEADMPMIVGQRGVVFIEGASQLAPPGELIQPVDAPPQTADPEGDDAEPGSDDDIEQQPQQPARAPRQIAPAPAQKALNPGASIVDRVREQLLDDYPADAMGWIDSANWTGPVQVPLDQIDYSDAQQWAAAGQPKRVKKFRKKISRGLLKPMILLKTPGNKKLIVIDGHHRGLAYKDLGIPATAYVGTVDTDAGPWDEMHDSQGATKTAGADPVADAIMAELRRQWAEKSAELTRLLTVPHVPDLTAEQVSEVVAFKRYRARRDGRPNARPFLFKALSEQQARAAQIFNDAMAGTAEFAKAGDGADPKAPRSAREWPGWTRDEATAAYYSKRIRQQLKTSFSTTAVANGWMAARGAAKAAGDPQTSDALTWLAQYGITTAVLRTLRHTLNDAYAEGYWIGTASAISFVTADDVDWSGWRPGDADAARLVLDENGNLGLQQLLDSSGITLQGITDTTMGDLAQALADALARGDSAATLAKALNALLDDPARADRIAVTEISRAVSAASMNTYERNGVEATQWLTALDDRVCPVCDGNQDDGPVPLRSAFSSGDVYPPAHPLCRCALDPVTLTGSDAAAAVADAGMTEGEDA